MTWDDYRIRFIEQAKKNNYDDVVIGKFLFYAKSLFYKNIPIIFDVKHLSLLVGYSVDYLMGVSNASENFYRTFFINKRNGKEREISEPLPSLKEIQRWVLDEILSKSDISKFAKGYALGKSIKDNARFHRKQKMLLNLDIKDFFPSIKIDKVYLIFKKLGYSKGVSMLLANICCLNEALPQGAPTSPVISNLVMGKFDKRVGSFCISKNIKYTRYADDLTFSGDFEPGFIIKFINKILLEDGFELNVNKIKTRRPHQAQIVTGVVVNEKIQAPRKVRRELRQNIYYINKYGISSHIIRKEILKSNYIKHLLGVANNILFLNPKDRDAIFGIETLKNLLKVELSDN